MLIKPETYEDRAEEYTADGWTVADWLHDEAIQCQCCDRYFDDRADFVDPEDYDDEARWICEECSEGLPLTASARDAVAADRRCDEARA